MGKYLQMLDDYKQEAKKSICPNPVPTELTKGTNDSFVSNVSAQLVHIEISNNWQARLSRETLNTINAWFKLINETNKESIEHVVDACFSNPETLQYVLEQFDNQNVNKGLYDDRRLCSQCLNLGQTGLCNAALQGKLKAIAPYYPYNEILRRCEAYKPDINDLNKSLGEIRWPNLARRTEIVN